MGEHHKVFEVVIGEDRYYVSAGARHYLEANLSNLGIEFDSLKETSRKIERVGTSLFMDNTLERPLTVSQLRRVRKEEGHV